ncbi:GyrI-like domain-containing protein [Pseudomonas sp. NA-150]|uniref:AraC family transcriptional regulator n=1 Tax=Pseudomonas sp. NA-150 TaxID=3367525 RepID=UPI0037C9A24F
MDITIKSLPSARIAYMRQTGPYGPAIGVFWRDVFGVWMENNGLLHQVRYGIGLDDPQVTPAAQCRYDACVEVPESFDATPPASIRTLPGGEHAVTRFTGTGAEIGQAWMDFYGELQLDGVETAKGPYFERYGKDSSYNPATGVMSCELCIPLKG